MIIITFLFTMFTSTIFTSNIEFPPPLLNEKIDNYEFTVYEGTRLKDIVLNHQLKNLLENKTIKKPTKKYFLPLFDKPLKLITDHPDFNYDSTYSKEVTLYTYNGHQCVIVGGYCPETGKKFIFHFNYNFEKNAKKREFKLFHLLSRLYQENKTCTLVLLSGFYTKNVAAALSVVESTGYKITYADINPLYMPNPLEPYQTGKLTLFRMKNNFHPTIHNITKGKKLAILPNGEFVIADIPNVVLAKKLNQLRMQRKFKRKKKEIVNNIKKIVTKNIVKFVMRKIKKSLLQ